MLSLFTFTGKMRLRYAVAALAAFSSQHLVIAGIFRALRHPLTLDAWFLLTPFRPLVRVDQVSTLLLLPALACILLIVAWVLAALAFRRAADAGVSEWIAAYAIAPIVQIPIFLFLCVAPPRAEQEGESPAGDAAVVQSKWIAQGVLAESR